MKKICLKLILLSVLFSCDKLHDYKYKIENKTNQKLQIQYLGQCDWDKIDSTILIEKDSAKIIFTATHGAEGHSPYNNPKHFDIKEIHILNSNMKATKNLSDSNNWRFVNVKDETGLYILTIDATNTK